MLVFDDASGDEYDGMSFTMQDDADVPLGTAVEGDYRSSTSCSYMYMYSRTFTSLGVVASLQSSQSSGWSKKLPYVER